MPLHGSMLWFRRGGVTSHKGGLNFMSSHWLICEQLPASLTDCAEGLVSRRVCVCVGVCVAQTMSAASVVAMETDGGKDLRCL